MEIRPCGQIPINARRTFIGGSDARIIMGKNEAALLRLWHEKRGEVEQEDLSGNLIVQLGLVTEPLNRHWFERNTGQVVAEVQRRVQHQVIRYLAATLDGMVEPTSGFRRKFCCRGRSPKTARRNTCPSSSTICRSRTPRRPSSRSSPVAANG